MLKTIEELIIFLDNRFENNSFQTIEEFGSILESYHGQDWKNYRIFSNESYQRVQLKVCDVYELVLIFWKSGQGSKVHNHAERGCLVKMLHGNLTEIRYNIWNQKVEEINYIENSLSYIHNKTSIHKIINESNIDSVLFICILRECILIIQQIQLRNIEILF